MKIIQKIKNLFKKKPILPENVNHEDAMAREVIAKCFNSGKPVFASRDKDGNIVMKGF